MMMPGSGIANSRLNSHSPRSISPSIRVAGDIVDVGGHRGDATRQERLCDEPAIVGVDGRVGALQRLDVTPTPLAQDGLVSLGVVDLQTLLRATAAAAAGEQFRVGEHVADVLVTGHHHRADLGHREHGALLVELLIEIPRVVLDHRVEHRVIHGTREGADPILERWLCHGGHYSRRPTPDSERRGTPTGCNLLE